MSTTWVKIGSLTIESAVTLFDTALGATAPLTLPMRPGPVDVYRSRGLGADPMHHRTLRLTNAPTTGVRGSQRIGVVKIEFGQVGVIEHGSFCALSDMDDPAAITSMNDQLCVDAGAGEVHLAEGNRFAFARVRYGAIVFPLLDASGRAEGIEVDLELYEREFLEDDP